MSLQDFQLVDNEPIDNSIIKRDFKKYITNKELIQTILIKK